MTNTYTPTQRFTKQQVATNPLVWGNTLNSGVIELIDEAVAANVTIDVTSGNVTLSDESGASSQARTMTLLVTGTPVAPRTVFVSGREKLFNVHNACGQTVTVRTTAGVGVAVLNNTRVTLFVRGNEVFHPQLHRSQTVEPDTTTMDAISCAVTSATGGTTNPTLYKHREGDHVSISCNLISVTVAATTFVITGAFFTTLDDNRAYHQYILEGTSVIEAVMEFYTGSIVISKADGSAWTNPSTRVIPGMTFSFRVDD